MNKSVLFLSVLFLSACTSNEYLGEDMRSEKCIQLGSCTSVLSRAAGNADADEKRLEKYVSDFKVYGVKGIDSETPTYTVVFDNYVVAYNHTPTTSNLCGWEYVKGNQYIKYWDYSMDRYRFWAVAPASKATFQVGTDGAVSTATIEAIPAQQSDEDAVFIALPKEVKRSDFNKTVTLSFQRLQARVRVGFYETVPGYKVSDLVFYQGSTPTEEVTLNGHFLKKSGFTVTFDQTKNRFSTAALSTGQETVTMLLFGTIPETALLSGCLRETSAVASMVPYLSVLPAEQSTDHGDVSLQVDYLLTSLDAVGEDADKQPIYETIRVKGATAVIPAALTQWLPNHSYTYLFKISDQTNGTTGSTGDKEGLFPISFDAVVELDEENLEGYVATISEPSITTYQAGSSTYTDIKYVAGTAIDIYVMEGANQVTFSDTKKMTISGPGSYSMTSTVSSTKVTIPATDVKEGDYTIQYENTTTASAVKRVTKIISVGAKPVGE